jgi:hypothetical protein
MPVPPAVDGFREKIARMRAELDYPNELDITPGAYGLDSDFRAEVLRLWDVWRAVLAHSAPPPKPYMLRDAEDADRALGTLLGRLGWLFGPPSAPGPVVGFPRRQPGEAEEAPDMRAAPPPGVPPPAGARGGAVAGVAEPGAAATNPDAGPSPPDPPAVFVPVPADLTILRVLDEAKRALLVHEIVSGAAALFRGVGGAASRAAGLIPVSEDKVRERIPLLIKHGLAIRPLGAGGKPTRRKGVGITPQGQSFLRSASPPTSR